MNEALIKHLVGFLNIAKYLNHSEIFQLDRAYKKTIELAKSIKQFIFHNNLIIVMNGPQCAAVEAFTPMRLRARIVTRFCNNFSAADDRRSRLTNGLNGIVFGARLLPLDHAGSAMGLLRWGIV